MEMVYGKKALILIHMKVNTSMIKNLGTVFLLGKMEIFIKATIVMINEMDMDKCIGLMVQFIKEIG
jgi:hypothetical protein